MQNLGRCFFGNADGNEDQVSLLVKRNLDDEEEDEENWLDGVRGKSPNALDGNSFLSQNLMARLNEMDHKRLSLAKTNSPNFSHLPKHDTALHFDGTDLVKPCDQHY